jgi:CubicO group peptidase (beta-lactamase class C family)
MMLLFCTLEIVSNFPSMTKKLLLTAWLQFLIAVSFCQEIRRIDQTSIGKIELETQIKKLIQAANVHGLAITIFNNNHPVYSKTFGYKNFETKKPILPATNFYGASLSKAVFAVFVMKLVEEGKIDLDKPLADYLPNPIYDYPTKTKWHDNYADFKNLPAYKKLTARMCLSHTTGLPNWRWDNKDQKLNFAFAPGSRYGYSGEGMVYLQVVLERMFNRSLEDMIKEKIFIPAGMKNSSYTWQPRFENDYVFGHQSDGKLYEKDKDNEARSASTLETTLEDYTKFTEAVLNHKIINKTSTDLMWTPQIKLKSVQQFGPNRFKDSTLNDAIDLSYGLGWVLLKSPYGKGAFKEGHGDGFQHYSILFPEKGIGVILMSNSDNAESIFKELLEITIGDKFTPWYWENYIPYNYQSN